jgi:hypothetical protein
MPARWVRSDRKQAGRRPFRQEARTGIGHLSCGCGLKMEGFEREPSLDQFNSGTAHSNSFDVRLGVQLGGLFEPSFEAKAHLH